MFGSEHNVQVHSQSEPKHLFRFRFDGLTEPNLEHLFGFRFEHCSECSEPDRGQSTQAQHSTALSGTMTGSGSSCSTLRYVFVNLFILALLTIIYNF